MFDDERESAKEMSLFLVGLQGQGSAVSETRILVRHEGTGSLRVPGALSCTGAFRGPGALSGTGALSGPGTLSGNGALSGTDTLDDTFHDLVGAP